MFQRHLYAVPWSGGCLSCLRYVWHLHNQIENDQSIKDLKRRIIEEYTGSPSDDSELIPLKYQISELRITYDARYLEYMVQKLLKKEEYEKALYCLLTYKLIEPDHPKLESWRARIGSWITEPDLPTYKAPAPADLVLLDANALFPLAFTDAGGYRFDMPEPTDIDYAITPSVMAELRTAWKYHLERARSQGADITALKQANDPESFASKVIEVEPVSLNTIRDLYREYPFRLEKILYHKIARMTRLSDKLKELSTRDTLLPEDGDLRLLGEAIALSKDHKVAILSRDEDFWAFQGLIKENFGIEIIRPEEPPDIPKRSF